MDEQTAAITLDMQMTPVVNYAQQQNGLPLVRRITVENGGTAAWEDLEVRLFAAEDFVEPARFGVERLPPGETAEIGSLKLTLRAERLAQLTERAVTTLTAEVWQGERRLASIAKEVVFLAFDEWQGSGYYPELLTAFVTPNHPEIAKLMRRASELLNEWTGSPSFDAYQTQNPNRVLRQAAALYGAIQELNIVYAVPPASFEAPGQRVRLCDAVTGTRMGGCLDVTLLYAACLEAAGLYPLLLLKKNHIFAGVWLEEMTFQDAVRDDPALVSKRMADGIGEIAVVECTGAVAGKNMDFDEARAAAAAEMGDDEPVRYVIDVHRARLAGIRPLPLRVQTGRGWRVEADSRPAAELTAAPEEIAARVPESTGQPPARKTLDARGKKILQWERKLLDLGLRNTLLNLRASKRLIPVLAASLPQLEDALADGRQFSVSPRPQEWRLPEGAPHSLEPLPELPLSRELLHSEYQNGRLRSLMSEAELQRAVKELYRAAKVSLEENGANSLYLSLGLLRWYESERSERPRYAPLVLLPVELVRRAANKGYGLRLRDEEPAMNVTLLEMLKQNFGIVIDGLDPLPADEYGADVVRVFTAVRRAVMQQKRWDVIESAFVGIFSFSRFVMWNDIRNRMDDLEKNKVVRSLMDGKLSWDAAPMEPPRELDEAGLLLPLPADSSQLYAVKAAVEGETFVLHGPPGTGKSQTITGLIVNVLAQGKTVLFVAEKMAALSVVQKRLRKLGLDPFCLELHSNKARKKDVLEQLRAAAEVGRAQKTAIYAQKSEQAARLRAELAEYPRRLHEKRASGLSVYQMINAYEPLSDADDAGISLDSRRTAAWTPDDLERSESLLGRLAAAARAIGHPGGHPLRLVVETEYSQRLRSQLPSLTEDYRARLGALEESARTFAARLGRDVPRLKKEYEQLRDIAAELSQWRECPRRWSEVDDAGAYLRGVQEMAWHCRSAAETGGGLLKAYRPAFLEQDGEALRGEWNEIKRKWLLPRLLAESGFVKKISSYSFLKRSKEDVPGDLDRLSAYRAELTRARQLLQEYGPGLGPLDRGGDTDWGRVGELARRAEQSALRLDQLGAAALRQRHAADPESQRAAAELLRLWQAQDASRGALNALLRTGEPSSGEDWLAALKDLCAALLDKADVLRDWILWNSLCGEAENAGLGSVVLAYRNGLAHDKVLPAYRKVCLRSLIEDAVDGDPVLNRFSGAVFNEKIAQIKGLVDELARLARAEACAALAARVPDFTREASQNSELGILQRAIRSGGRSLSIRRLFEQLPNLLPRLCPCMLMSPISAAQYLDPRREMFDLVVFDEASQLTTSKAVGALARGRNAVIVGDPKQMPPTSFFMTNLDDREEDLEVADLTSILDDCLALGMPETHLLWHYRSRHESLIAFSNNQFYENKLYTFPSANDRVSKVSFVKIDGTFDRGGSRTNRAEAEAVVAEVIRRAKDPARRGESVGVVTFNISQQNLIDDLFEEARGQDPDLEKWYQESEEPLFIKNLENVQGDERDVILFSIGFGADREGRVSMNFGPVNQAGGWRRLNVAVSRSRTEMMVFSSLEPEQIDLSRTASEGVAALKAFLQYARSGYLPLRLAGAGTTAERELDGIAAEICAKLNERGYETARQIGHSKFRIDIGVVDPEQPGEYLLGVLLDGGAYRDARMVREREISQIGVLKGLGWTVERLWTMDWWDNKKRELDRLLRRIEASRAARREEREAERRAAEEAAKAEAEAAARRAAESEAPAAVMDGGGGREIFAAPGRAAAADRGPELIAASVSAPPSAPEKTLRQNARLYRPALLPEKKLTAAEFSDLRSEKLLRSRVEAIVRTEAPISAKLLARRLLQSLGMSRLGPRAQKRLDELLASMKLRTTERDGVVWYWHSGQDPDGYEEFRVSGAGAAKRDAADIPAQEAANALCEVLREQIALPGEDLLRETAKKLGYPRAGAGARNAAAAGLALASSRGLAALDRNGCWTLK